MDTALYGRFVICTASVGEGLAPPVAAFSSVAGFIPYGFGRGKPLPYAL